MKEKYEAHAVIAKLTELLEQAAERRLSHTTPMENLCANMEPSYFEGQLIDALSPNGGVQTLYSLAYPTSQFRDPSHRQESRHADGEGA